jgi:hypothetical protein
MITYLWTASQGDIIGSDDIADWLAPPDEGIYTITLRVTDGRGGSATASISLMVLDPEKQMAGDMIAWYPFEGNALDISGNRLHGQVFGAKLSSDSLGNASAAYFFDGVNDHILVPNENILNFNKGITVSLFAQPQTLGDKERFLISHGSWQHRWKLSITPDRKVRWTLKNTTGQVKDLDSQTSLERDKFYHIAASYDGRFMLLYINGQLEHFTTFSGDLNASPVDLEIGQILPDDPMYSFRGVLDEIKIYDFALQPDSVAVQSGHVVTGNAAEDIKPKIRLHLYPNPARESVVLDISSLGTTFKTSNPLISIWDSYGRQVWNGAFGDAPVRKIDVSALHPGLYHIHLVVSGHVWNEKFIIQY